MANQRTHALDNLRTCLTALVILHHASTPYGGAGPWPYTSPLYMPNSSPILLTFNVINQTFFMATFFLISAYFSSIAARKKTRHQFPKEKWKRLGVPTLVFSLIVKGAARGILAWRLKDEDWVNIGREVLEGLKIVRGVSGPVWYCALLLIFDGLYAGLLPSHFADKSPSQKAIFKAPSDVVNINVASPTANTTNSTKEPHTFRTTHVLAAVTLTSISSFVIRLYYPVGRPLWPISLQLAYASQYVLYYTTGIYIHRSGRSLQGSISPSTLRVIGTSTALITSIGLFHIQYLTRTGMSSSQIMPLVFGGPNMLALLYALFNEFAGFFIASLILKAFYNARMSFLGKRWSVGKVDLSVYSYAAFMVHGPVVLDLQCLFGKKGWEGMGAVETAFSVGILGVAESWVIGMILKKAIESVRWKGYL